MTTTAEAPNTIRYYAEEAGMLLDANGRDYSCLIARFHDFAITAEAKLVLIDRPAEWPDGRYGSWSELDIQNQCEDGMKYTIALVEYLMELQKGVIDCDNLRASLRAFCCGMRFGLLYQPAVAMIGVSGHN